MPIYVLPEGLTSSGDLHWKTLGIDAISVDQGKKSLHHAWPKRVTTRKKDIHRATFASWEKVKVVLNK
jgi:hypothetical protein